MGSFTSGGGGTATGLAEGDPAGGPTGAAADGGVACAKAYVEDKVRASTRAGLRMTSLG